MIAIVRETIRLKDDIRLDTQMRRLYKSTQNQVNIDKQRGSISTSCRKIYLSSGCLYMCPKHDFVENKFPPTLIYIYTLSCNHKNLDNKRQSVYYPNDMYFFENHEELRNVCWRPKFMFKCPRPFLHWRNIPTRNHKNSSANGKHKPKKAAPSAISASVWAHAISTQTKKRRFKS